MQAHSQVPSLMKMKYVTLFAWATLAYTTKALVVNTPPPRGEGKQATIPTKQIPDNDNLVKRFQYRTYVQRDIKTPDPIPEEGQQAALDLMASGRLYRYNVAPGEDSIVSLCEQEIAEYTGFNYCVGLNSCGSALMLLLKTTGLQPGGKVLSNAFTFGAVPSAIEHAQGKAIYVESNTDHVINVVDLQRKLQDNPDAKHVLISHMRGKVADMDAIKELCDKYGVVLWRIVPILWEFYGRGSIRATWESPVPLAANRTR